MHSCRPLSFELFELGVEVASEVAETVDAEDDDGLPVGSGDDLFAHHLVIHDLRADGDDLELVRPEQVVLLGSKGAALTLRLARG